MEELLVQQGPETKSTERIWKHYIWLELVEGYKGRWMDICEFQLILKWLAGKPQKEMFQCCQHTTICLIPDGVLHRRYTIHELMAIVSVSRYMTRIEINVVCNLSCHSGRECMCLLIVE